MPVDSDPEAGVADAGGRTGEIARNRRVSPNQRPRPAANIRSENLSLCLAGSQLCRGAAGPAVSHRKIVSDDESRVMGVFDRVENAVTEVVEYAGLLTGDA
jgi:hypothetical protein